MIFSQYWLIFGLLVTLSFIDNICCGQHSTKWDNYIRTKRQTQYWQNKKQFPVCTLGNTRQYDALGRRKSGILVTPGSQGNCGSCWAFAATHTFADQININANTRNAAAFSQEHLTKCLMKANGCCGGSAKKALAFFQTNGAVPVTCLPYTLQNYPDVNSTVKDTEATRNRARKNFKINNPLVCQETCTDNTDPTTQLLAGYTQIHNENDAVAAVDRGPVLARMRSNSEFIDYRCGVFSGQDLSQISPNHAVEIVDYSSPSYDGPTFWVVKNSWGTEPGEDGYFRIVRGRNQLTGFISLNVNGNTLADQTDLSTTIDCGAQEVSNLNQNILVQSAAEFGLEELLNRGLIMCDGSDKVSSIELVSLLNATQQVIEGFMLDVTVEARVIGCSSSTYVAVIGLSVMLDMDNSFSLLDYSYHVKNSDVAVTKISSYGLLAASSLICMLLYI